MTEQAREWAARLREHIWDQATKSIQCCPDTRIQVEAMLAANSIDLDSACEAFAAGDWDALKKQIKAMDELIGKMEEQP